MRQSRGNRIDFATSILTSLILRGCFNPCRKPSRVARSRRKRPLYHDRNFQPPQPGKVPAAGRLCCFPHRQSYFAGEGPGKTRRFTGIVIYLGERTLSFGNRLFALPSSVLWSRLDLWKTKKTAAAEIECTDRNPRSRCSRCSTALILQVILRPQTRRSRRS